VADDSPDDDRIDPRVEAEDLIESRRGDESAEMVGRAGTLVAGFWNTAQMVVPTFGTLIVSIIIGRFLGPSELGEQSWIAYIEGLLVALIIQTLVRTGIQTMSTARGAGDVTTYDALSRWIMWGQIAGGTVSALVLFLFGVFTDNSASWFLVSATSAANAIGWAYSVRIISEKGWAPVAKRRLITQLLAQGIAAAAVVAGLGIAGVFAANLIAAVVLWVMVWRMSDPARGPYFPRVPRQLWRLWGMYLATELLNQVVARRIEFLFLGALSTRSELAMYSISFAVISSVTTIPDSMVTAFLPSLAGRAGAGQGSVVDDHLLPAIRVTLTLSVALTAGLAVLSPRLITMLYGEDFALAGQLTAYMSLLVLFVPLFDLLDTYWGGYGRLGFPLIAVAIGGVVDLVLAFLLIGRYGAVGAVIANVSGQFVAALVLLGFTYRRLRHMRLDWPRYLLVIVVCLIAAGLGWWVLSLIPGLLGWLACFATMLVVLLGFGTLIGFTSRADGLWLRDSMPGKLQPFVRFYAGPIGSTD